MRKYIDLQKKKAKTQKSKVKTARFVRKAVRKPAVKKTAAVVGIFALLISSFGAFPQVTLAASIGPNSADTFGNDSSIGTESWSDTSDAQSSNNDWSEVDLGDNQVSKYLKATDFDFAIPGDAIIDGIVVEVEKKAEGTNRIKDYSVKMVQGGTISGDNKATSSFWAASDFYETYGSATDTWGLTWTPSDINATNFGVAFSAKKDTTAGSDTDARVDHIRITVHYSDPPQPGVLHVIKVVDGGDADASEFTIDVTGGNASPSQFAGSAAGTDVTIDAGASFDVVEQDPGADYAASYSTDCSGTMPEAGELTCTITNTFVPPPPPEKAIVIVTKIVSNDNGGGAVIGSFDLFVDATQVSSGDQTEVDPGSYVISESGGPDGYASTIGGDCDGNGNVTAEADGIYECVITNDDIAPSLTLVKEVVGGDAPALDWTLTATGDQDVPTILSGEGSASSDGTLQAGTYTLSESAGPANYVPGSWSCEGDAENVGDQITLNVGQSATCTITNTFVPPQEQEETLGSITVCKIIIDQDGNITDGSEQSDVTFTIPWLTPDPETSQGAPVQEIDPDATFTTTLDLDTQILGDSEGEDAQCVVYEDLALGGYYYGEEQISSGSWENPMYNDQFETALTTLSDFFVYDGNLFDGNPADDEDRNFDADGHIVLTEERPDRTLVVLNQDAEQLNPGAITICKIIIDADDNVIDGSAQSGIDFTITGFTPNPETSEGAPVGELPETVFTTPITFNADFLSDVEGNDAECVTYDDLPLGGYFYSQEDISGGTWESPLYNDQFQTTLTTLLDFFGYDGNLFDGNPADDDNRNFDADGHIVLNVDRPERTLVVLNQHKVVVEEEGPNDDGPVITSGSSGGSSGGGGGGSPADPNLNTPAPTVGGAQTPPPQVAGETLPRTGMDIVAIGLLFALVGYGTLMPKNAKTEELRLR